MVQLSRLFGEARHAVAALFAGAKVILKERVVLGADNGEVVAHDDYVAVVVLVVP